MNSDLRPARWNPLRAAGAGALVGPLFALSGIWQGGGQYPVEYWLGAILGGAVLGAVVAGVVAGVRNRLVRAV